MEYRKFNPIKAKYHLQYHVYLMIKRCMIEEGMDVNDVVYEGFFDDKNLLVADIFIPKRNLIINVDGPSHFIGNTSRRVGKDFLDMELKRLFGFRVKEIHFNKWNEMVGEQKSEWLK